jgi:predicted acylesterase/phospholipase RssA
MTIKHIVLSGGGPISLYGFGVIKKLLNKSIFNMSNIQSIHGTSSGALIAFFISSGININELHQYFYNFPYDKHLFVTFENILNLRNNKGILSLKQLDKFIDPALHSLNWDLNITLLNAYKKTNIELNIYAVRFDDFKLINFNHNEYPNVTLKDALYSSCSLPYMFEPHSFLLNKDDMKNTFFIDGGIINNVPIGTCIEKYFNNEYNSILNNNYERILDEILCVQYKENDTKEILTSETNIIDYSKLFIKKILKYIEKDDINKYTTHLKYNFTLDMQDKETNWMKLYESKEERERAIQNGEEQAELILEKIYNNNI